MREFFDALHLKDDVNRLGGERYRSCFAVSDFASSAFAVVGSAIATLADELNLTSGRQSVTVNQRLASLWFAQSIKPVGWEMPPLWDAIAGDYQTKDEKWIKLHTNLPQHRKAALEVLESRCNREHVTAAVGSFEADTLETAIVQNGGVAAMCRSSNEWAAHAQGMAVSQESLIHISDVGPIAQRQWSPSAEQPLNGLRVLDLTRVLAGPVATRTLAGFGANVQRIDPPGWDEANVVPDITPGKRCSYLDLRNKSDRQKFEELLSTADVFVHGYRPGALNDLGYDKAARTAISPNTIDVCLDAYGWSGPWATRRGFDSLVQMSSGIADAGMSWAKRNQPTPLPVQALDHATGYLMAAFVIRALVWALHDKRLYHGRLSLARTAQCLKGHRQIEQGEQIRTADEDDYCAVAEQTQWGPLMRLQSALAFERTTMNWPRGAVALGSDNPSWV